MRGTKAGSAGPGRGFSLIELVVVIAIVLILAGGAVPNIMGSVQRGRVQTAALQMAEDLRLVRENAILYQEDLYVYISTDTAVNKQYWYEQFPFLNTTTGLPDGSHNVPPVGGAASPDSSRFVRATLPFSIHVVSISSSTGSVTWNGHAYQEIRFRSGEDPSNPGNALYIPGSIAASVSIVVGDSSGHQWRVVVDAIGRPRISQVTS